MSIEQWRWLHAREKRERFERMFFGQLAAAKLELPEKQYAFAAPFGRDWRADFAWPSHRLLVEVNGGVWRKDPKTGQRAGAHPHPTAILRDWQKLNDAATLRWYVLQFSSDDVKKGRALTALELWFQVGPIETRLAVNRALDRLARLPGPIT